MTSTLDGPGRDSQISPNDLSEMFHAAARHFKKNELDLAEPLLRKIDRIHPNHPDTLYLLGSIAHARGNSEEGVGLIERSLELNPGNSIAHNNLGNALQALGRSDEAMASFVRAIENDQSFVDAYYNLGNLHRAQGRFEAAVGAYLKVIQIRPDYYPANVNLANVYRTMGSYEKAIVMTNRTIDLIPDKIEAHNNLGVSYNDMGRFEKGLECFERALEIAPEDIDTLYNRSFALLGLGRLKEGWAAYEHRLQKPESTRLAVPYPVWDGGPLDDKTVLVRAEQGIGDDILFGTCLPDLIDVAGHCVIECEPRLESLYKRSFPRASVFGVKRTDMDWYADAPEIDASVMLGSLLGHFRPDIDSFPKLDRLLTPDPKARADFAHRLAALGPGFKVGISWRSKKGRLGPFYSRLEQWREIFEVPGAVFVNLQYDQADPEIAEAAESFGVEIHNLEGLDLLDDFDGVAALIAELDLVIAPNNTVECLAGAIGTRSLSLALDSEWWLFGTGRGHWYANTEYYFSNAAVVEWQQALIAIARDLRVFVGERESSRVAIQGAA